MTGCQLLGLGHSGSRRAEPRRRALTLLEVLLSLVIFATALTVLGQMGANGVRAAIRARLQTQAVLRCQSKLAEVVTGVEPLVPVPEAAFADDPQWHWRLETHDTGDPTLLSLRMTVSHAAKQPHGRISFTMVRLLHAPRSPARGSPIP
jgi:type II secretion system protein I